jgi:hypothetical protein
VSEIIVLLLKLQGICFILPSHLLLFGAKANHTTIHILDHIRTITLFDNMHCEIWFSIKANAIHIIVFGCVAFAHIPKEICHKFFHKSKNCVFTSYINHYNKAYHLWDVEINKIIGNQDAMFMKILLEI